MITVLVGGFLREELMYQMIRDVYNHIGDDVSRKIYANRLLFSLTGDKRYMTEIVRGTALYQEIHEIIKGDVRRR